MAKLNASGAKKARIACEAWRGYFKENINTYHEMHEFVLGKQWTEDDENEMIKTYRKVPLTANKLGTMANSLLGEQQQNTPQLQVVPMTECNEEVAHLRELIVKDIMFSTDSTIVYQTAASQTAIGGFSAFGLNTRYMHDKSFDQDIEYISFKDATRCYFDVGAESINKTDGMFCGYIVRLTRQKFKDVYGKDVEKKIDGNDLMVSEQEVALTVEPGAGTDPFNWSDGEGVTLIHHFVKKVEKDTLYKLSNGKILNQIEMDDLIVSSQKINDEHKTQELQQELMQLLTPDNDAMQPDNAPMPQQLGNEEFGMSGNGDILPRDDGLDLSQFANNEEEIVEDEVVTLWDENEVVRIEDSRPSKKHKIMHYIYAGDYELDKSVFPSEQLPIVFVDNNSFYDKAGKQRCRTFFQDCRDTQRYINYLRTQCAYILKVSRYDQWIGSKANVKSLDTQRDWRDPTTMKGMLTYDESPNGNKPEPIRPPELSASLFQQYQLAVEDLYTCSGLYPTRMGNQGNEVSGKAIDARTRQGSYSTYVFFNSINRAIAKGGEIVNEMIPLVYDSERVIALMTPDEGLKNITVNKQRDEYGEQIENDIRKGTYQVRLKPGASYEGQKQEALESLREVLQADPTAFNLVADLYADNLPLANNIEIRNRLKTRVDPKIIQAGKTGNMPPPDQNPTPEQMAMKADAEFKQQQIQIKLKELEIKQQQTQADIEIENMKLEIAKMELSAGVEEQRIRYLAETDRTKSDNAISHADNLVKLMTHKDF